MKSKIWDACKSYKILIFCLFIQIASILLNFFISIFTANTLNVTDFGKFQFYFNSIVFYSFLSKLGLDTLSFKLSGRLDEPQERTTYLIYAFAIILCMSVLFASIHTFFYDQSYSKFGIVTSSILGLSLTTFFAGFCKARGLPVKGVILEGFVFRILTLTSLLALYQFNILCFKSISLTILLVSFILLLYVIKEIWENIGHKIYFKGLKSKYKLYFRLSIVFAALSISQEAILMADMYAVEKFLGIDIVSIQSIVARFVGLFFIFNSICIGVFSPRLISHYEKDQFNELNELIVKINRILGGSSLISIVLFLLLGKFVLGLFGDNYLIAYDYILIMYAGCAVNVSLGLSGVMLATFGFAKDSVVILVCSLLIKLVLLYFGAKLFDLYGVIISSSFVFVLWKASMSIQLYRRTSIISFRLK
ncbi:TPA: hypothetical protein NJ263_002854 [Vibrio parahaemolyticus]|nr:hypothetical protein [Vibrio parahaemolyticus]